MRELADPRREWRLELARALEAARLKGAIRGSYRHNNGFSRCTIDAVVLRRHAISLFLAALASKLDRFVVSGSGAAVLIDIPSRRVIAATGGALAERSLFPPGSTLKPFVLAALMKSGKLSPSASFACPGRLRIGRRTLHCSHPR